MKNDRNGLPDDDARCTSCTSIHDDIRSQLGYLTHEVGGFLETLEIILLTKLTKGTGRHVVKGVLLAEVPGLFLCLLPWQVA